MGGFGGDGCWKSSQPVHLIRFQTTSLGVPFVNLINDGYSHSEERTTNLTIIFILLVLIVPLSALLISTSIGKGLKVSTVYQGFSNGIMTGEQGAPLNKSIFWILYPNMFSIPIYLILFWIDFKHPNYASLFVPVFWGYFTLWIFKIHRQLLVEWPLYITIQMFSLLLSVWFSFAVFQYEPQELTPDKSDVIFQFWFGILIFSLTIINEFQTNRSDYNKKLARYWKSSALDIEKMELIPPSLEKDSDLYLLLLAVLVKENFERPKIIRRFDRRTHGIAQVQGERIDDKTSVKLALELIRSAYEKYLNDNSDNQIWDSNMGYSIGLAYNNNDEQYANNISEIFQSLKENLRK